MVINDDWTVLMKSLNFPMDTERAAQLLRVDKFRADRLLEGLREYDLLDWKQGGNNWFLTGKGEAFCQYLQCREEFEQLAQQKMNELVTPELG